MSEIPQPEAIYARTKEEGARWLKRPLPEMISTALAAGFDIVAGVTALVLVSAQLEHWTGRDAAHVFGSIAFGIGFVFLVVGRAAARRPSTPLHGFTPTARSPCSSARSSRVP